jgi:sulfopropanediol 3-dehydrogenase
MSVHYLKRATRTPASGEDETRRVVAAMLREIEAGGEAVVRAYTERFDRWTGDLLVTAAEIAAAEAALPATTKDDIRFSHEQVRRFAQAQRDSMTEFSVELSPGLVTGQRLVPVDVAGCYVPGGRYAHIASAIMSVTTAKAAGVLRVIACSPSYRGGGIHPAILYALHLCGADTILTLGAASRRWRRSPSVWSPARRRTSSSGRAIATSRRPNGCCSGAWASMSSRAPRRS